MVIESALGMRLFRKLPHGIDYRLDLVRHGFTPKIVIDIGANEGQTAIYIWEAFPGAEIHSFEPVQTTFQRLVRHVSARGCHCVQKAVGRNVGEATIHVTADSYSNSLINKSPHAMEQQVAVTTVDAYTAEQGINSIDLLKIDTEGFDLEVLAGAERCFTERRVKFVLIEAGFHFRGNEHVQYELLHERLRSHGFDLFGFYHQTPCFTGANRLRFADALFAHSSTNVPRTDGTA